MKLFHSLLSAVLLLNLIAPLAQANPTPANGLDHTVHFTLDIPKAGQDFAIENGKPITEQWFKKSRTQPLALIPNHFIYKLKNFYGFHSKRFQSFALRIPFHFFSYFNQLLHSDSEDH